MLLAGPTPRFEETSEFRSTRLAGDRLAGNRYEPIPIEEIQEGVLQGYSTMLNLLIRWEHGELRSHDPDTGQHIVTYSDLQARAERERALADSNRALAKTERALAQTERTRANAEQEARMEAEVRVRELEADLGLRERQDRRSG